MYAVINDIVIFVSETISEKQKKHTGNYFYFNHIVELLLFILKILGLCYD